MQYSGNLLDQANFKCFWVFLISAFDIKTLCKFKKLKGS